MGFGSTIRCAVQRPGSDPQSAFGTTAAQGVLRGGSAVLPGINQRRALIQWLRSTRLVDKNSTTYQQVALFLSTLRTRPTLAQPGDIRAAWLWPRMAWRFD